MIQKLHARQFIKAWCFMRWLNFRQPTLSTRDPTPSWLHQTENPLVFCFSACYSASRHQQTMNWLGHWVFRFCNTDTLVWSDVKFNRVSSLQLCNRRQINSAWSWSTVHERCWSPATTTWEQGQVSISKVPRQGQLFHLHQAWEWTKGAHWWKSSSAKSHYWTPKVSLLTREHDGHWNYFVRDAPFIILGFCRNILVWSFLDRSSLSFCFRKNLCFYFMWGLTDFLH